MMKKWSSVDEVLDFAIGEEEGAVKFYTELAQQAANRSMRAAFEDFAREEQGHKQKLLGVKAGKTLAPAAKAVQDLKIADYVVDIEPNPDMTYLEAIILAMKKEKAAFRLYSDLAEAAEDENIKTLFLGLANEEAKHKLRFEIEYDDAMTDN
ncbi:ferritin family protein [Candidatus Latescibacterota bacterium]